MSSSLQMGAQRETIVTKINVITSKKAELEFWKYFIMNYMTKIKS